MVRWSRDNRLDRAKTRSGERGSIITALAACTAALAAILSVLAGINSALKNQALERSMGEIQEFSNYLKRKMSIPEICQKNFGNQVFTPGVVIDKTDFKEIYDTSFANAGMILPGTNGRVVLSSMRLGNFDTLQDSGPESYRGFAELELSFQGTSGGESRLAIMKVYVATDDGSGNPADENKIVNCSVAEATVLPSCSDGDTLVSVNSVPVCSRDTNAQVTSYREKFPFPCNPLPISNEWTQANPLGERCATLQTPVLGMSALPPLSETSGAAFFAANYRAKGKSTLNLRVVTPIQWHGDQQEKAFILAAWATVNGAVRLIGLEELANPRCRIWPGDPRPDTMCPSTTGATNESSFFLEVEEGDEVALRLNVLAFTDAAYGPNTIVTVGTTRMLDRSAEGFLELEEVSRP